MTTEDDGLGYYGSTATHWREDPARALLNRIFLENQDKTKAEVVSLFVEEVQKPEHLTAMEIALEYFGFNVLNLIIRAIERREYRKEDAAVKEEVEELKRKAKKQLIALGLLMPNGKRMRDCTGPEMISFGGWYIRIGEKVGDKKVGEVLSEEEVWQLRGA